MPIYEYRCEECGHVTETYRTVEDRTKAPECDDCGGATYKIISSYVVHGDFESYYDDNLQAHIKSKQHRRQVMKEQGVSEHFGQNWHTSSVQKRKV